MYKMNQKSRYLDNTDLYFCSSPMNTNQSMFMSEVIMEMQNMFGMVKDLLLTLHMGLRRMT